MNTTKGMIGRLNIRKINKHMNKTANNLTTEEKDTTLNNSTFTSYTTKTLNNETMMLKISK